MLCTIFVHPIMISTGLKRNAKDEETLRLLQMTDECKTMKCVALPELDTILNTHSLWVPTISVVHHIHMPLPAGLV